MPLSAATIKTTVIATISTRDDWNLMMNHQIQTDWVEWRIDALSQILSPEELVSTDCPYPMVLTVRCPSEGGQKEWHEGERKDWMKQLLPKAKAIDIEIAHLQEYADIVSLAKEKGVMVIGSAHDFKQFPGVSSLNQLIEKGVKASVDIVKVAFVLSSGQEMVDAGSLYETANIPLAFMGMGALGPVSRLYFSQLGSPLIYGFAGETPTAPGQWSAQLFKSCLSVENLD